MTGEITPSGSNILATTFKMLRFVGGNSQANCAKGLSGSGYGNGYPGHIFELPGLH